MEKPGWRETEREIIALVPLAAKTSSSRYAYIHWQTLHSSVFTFYETHINRPDTRRDTVAHVPSVTVIAVSQKKYADRLIRAAASRVFFFSFFFLQDSFHFCYVTATFCVESRILLHLAPFVLWPHRRKPSPVLTCSLPAVRLVILRLSKMRKICADCCYMSIFVSITKRRM